MFWMNRVPMDTPSKHERTSPPAPDDSFEPASPPAVSRVLIVAAHPAPQTSRANLAMIKAAKPVPHVTLHKLYLEYPDFFIDTRREQALLLDHDVIVLQHPLYWYSVPALLKEWIDMVLEHGWAYGSGGTKLVGKVWTHAFTTGGPEEAYAEGGYNRLPIEAFLPPLEQTARLCGMHWQPPFIAFAPRRRGDAAIEAEAQRYAQWIASLTTWHARARVHMTAQAAP